MEILFTMHLALPQLRLLQLLMALHVSTLVNPLVGQEPSPSLRQADADYREGVAALNRNDLETAESKFKMVVQLAPAADQGHSALGAVLVRLGQTALGIGELQKALSIDPADGSAQMNLALAYEQTGAPAKALPLFAKLESTAHSESKPLPSYALAAYIRALAAAGETTAAISKMKEAVAQDSHSAELHDELGSLYAQARAWGEAEQEYSQAIALNSGLAEAHLHLGFVLQAENKPGAAKEWIKAYSLAPMDPKIALTAVKALMDADRDEQAAPILEQLHRSQPRSSAVAYQLALVLQRVNRLPEAIQLFKSIVESEPRNADALINLGMALSQAHEATDAVPYLQRALAIKPAAAIAHQDLAAAYIQVNRVADAIVELRAALKLDPHSPQMHYDLGVAYKLEDDAGSAIPELETAQKLDPSGYEPAFVLGQLYMQVGRYPEAAQQLELSLKVHPKNGEAWAMLGSIDNKLDRLPEAVMALREAIHQLPDRADSHLILATVLMKQKQPDDAVAERKVGADLMRNHMNLQRAEVATNSGKSLLASGKVDDAIVQFRDAVTFDPSYAEAHLGLADALEKQGKTIEAAVERAEAKSRANPTNK
jgi:tetratricopeptide (TPR) repeat protein